MQGTKLTTILHTPIHQKSLKPRNMSTHRRRYKLAVPLPSAFDVSGSFPLNSSPRTASTRRSHKSALQDGKRGDICEKSLKGVIPKSKYCGQGQNYLTQLQIDISRSQTSPKSNFSSAYSSMEPPTLRSPSPRPRAPCGTAEALCRPPRDDITRSIGEPWTADLSSGLRTETK